MILNLQNALLQEEELTLELFLQEGVSVRN